MSHYTIKQVAQEIERIKPDTSVIFDYLHNSQVGQIQNHINNVETNIFVKLLLAELTLIYFKTHLQRWLGSMEETLFTDLLNANILYSHNYTSLWSIYDLGQHNDKFVSNAHILAHITNVKPYLPKYLKSKVFKSAKVTETKSIKSDDFTLAIFKKYAESLSKGFTSIEVESYLLLVKQLTKPEYKQKYIEILLDNCPKPSIKLQKELTSYTIDKINSNSRKSKYMYLDRHIIRKMALSLLIPIHPTISDDRHSDYKPFITGVKRSTTPDENQFLALFHSMIILKCQSEVTPSDTLEYAIEQISEHLQHKDYAKLMKKYIQGINKFNQITSELFKD